MKTEDLVVLAAAAVAVLAILSTQKKTTSQPAPKEVFEADGTRFDNGWRYFDNGTAMDPTGQWFANV